jgi:uracil-DNA glycosylase
MPLPILATDSIPKFESITQLRLRLHTDGCRRCSLGFQEEINGCCVSRGNPLSKLMIVGEAPGKEEDAKGLPFTGPAGRLMDKIWASVGMDTWSQWYITNVVKCRPYLPKGSGKENFTPKVEQQKQCRPYLDQEISLIKPRVIVLLGKVAVDNVLPSYKKMTMGAIRGQMVTFTGVIPVYFPMLHPAAILHAQRDPETEALYKQQTWDDIRFLKNYLVERGLI